MLTYGYDAYDVRMRGVSLTRLAGHAVNLLNDLSGDREGAGASSRPLIFVAHSPGGLVCKKAILLSRNNPEDYLQSIFNCTKGVIFIGTPHRGSWMADYACQQVALGCPKGRQSTPGIYTRGLLEHDTATSGEPSNHPDYVRLRRASPARTWKGGCIPELGYSRWLPFI